MCVSGHRLAKHYGEGRFINMVERRDGAPSLLDSEAFQGIALAFQMTNAMPGTKAAQVPYMFGD
jgi:hypothetical protein